MQEPELRAALVAALPRLRRVAHRIACPPTEPDDLVQDTVERAWRERSGFRGGAAVSTWLHRILVNRAIDLCRATRRARAGSAGTADPDDIGDFEVDDPAALACRASDVRALRAALSRLPTADRTVLALHDGEGWTARRVAEVCGLTTAAVQKRVQRGRIRLVRELATPAERAGRPAPECRAARADAPAFAEGALSGPRRAAVEEHLGNCDRCPSLLQALIGLRRAWERAPGPGPVPPEILSKVEDLLGADVLVDPWAATRSR
ncbi:RNA polymerase sigma factor [Pseudonocardia sp.]|uniref:RNA polymerase sigma factor n=1 Tax=Pseudonocardia sp. TaxID=60912 RepID=UPI00260C89BC|nr:RNA polymerase sigma factor [Pseudonocardia sp.]